ncbi:MAG: response regulator transcription factor [Planctomycetota bacterium]
MTRVLFTDDHAIVRQALKQLVSGCSDIGVANETGNGKEALEKALKGDFDMAVLDIMMLGLDCLDVLK